MRRAIFTVVAALSAIVADSDMSFTCDFERDTCGFTNQEGLDAQWERREMELEGKKGNMMVLEPNSTSTHLANIMTPYFEPDADSPGCFSFDLYTSEIQTFTVEQERNFGIIPVWVKKPDVKGWQKPRFNVDVDESTRFFFKTVLDGTKTNTLAALDNMRLELKKC